MAGSTATRRDWLAAATGAAAVAPLAAAGGKPAEPQALLFGTVFRDSYLALPGAKVVAFNEASPKKKYRTVTNYRGEYRIRVPAGDATYVVTASAPRFRAASRPVQVYGVDKTTANLILKPRKPRGEPADPGSGQ